MKRIVLSIAFMAAVLSASAAPVSQQEASEIASLVLKQSSVTAVATSYENLYVFNGVPGFVILAGDDCVLPLLGYSFDGTFNVEDMAESTAYWLQSYDHDISAARGQGLEATSEVALAWETIRATGAMPAKNRGSVNPLIATMWSQRSPYNMLCPEDCATGCVATAMAQIMKYWEYPKKGSGYHSYVHNTYGTQSANFETTTYDWDNIPLIAYNSSSEEVKQAVATLVYQCGVAVDMNYGTDVSSASSYKVADAMTNYFSYAPGISFEFQYNYSDSEWKTKLKNELDAGRPTYYAGQTSKGSAHAFICDGYDDQDNFHFNWGWGGSNDGYYAIGALNPGTQGPYNVLNYALFGIHPSSFMMDAPYDLTAAVSDRQVNLTWLPPHGAAFYKVYRDDELIAPRVVVTSYTDLDVCYGSHNYYVKAVFNTGDRSPRSNTATAEVEFSTPSPFDVQATLDGGDVTVTWEMPFGASPELAYGKEALPSSAYGYGGNNETYWGQRYPASLLSDNAGLSIKSVKVYAREVSNYTLYLCTGTRTGVTEILYEKEYYVDQVGWKELVLTSPMTLDYTRDLWVVMRAPASASYPAAYCYYDGAGIENASFISSNMNNFGSRDANGISWMLAVELGSDAYTYEVSKNGAVMVSGLKDLSYVDHNIAAGSQTYSIRSFFNGTPCSLPATCTITLVNVGVSSNNDAAGWVEGGGLTEVGAIATVKAYPKTGCVFLYWMQDGAVVSLSREYSFTVEGNSQLVANFQFTEISETDANLSVYPNPVKDQLHIESKAVIRQVQIVAANGVMVESKNIDACTFECHLGDYARGVYFVRLYTDEGVITKKLVLNE